MAKKVLFVGDTHCGHCKGITSPDWRIGEFKDVQKFGYDFILDTVKEIKPDRIICNGDLIDGPGHKDSTDHVTTDISRQQKMAVEFLDEIKKVNKKAEFFFTRGTPFHVKTDQENEDVIADYFKAEIQNELKLDINGLITSVKHTTSKGSTVYGSVTSNQRVNILQFLNDVLEDRTPAKFYVRSHIHEFNFVDRGHFAMLTTPAMQFAGTAYGRRLSSFYHFGVSFMEVENANEYQVYKRLLNLKTGKKERIIKC